MFYPKSPFTKCPEIESQLFNKWNKSGSSFLEWLCKTPKTTTYRVNVLKSNVEDVNRNFSDILTHKTKKPLKVFSIDDVPEVVCISNMNNSTLPIFDENLSEIIVNTNCGSSVLRGAHIYGPGVLAMPSGTKINQQVNVFADMDKKCKKGTNGCYESVFKVFLGIGIVKMQRHQLFGKNVDPRGIAVEMEETISGVPSIGDLSSNQALLQNFPSIICSRVLNPQPNEIILDMCAAPGNKTTHLVELMQDNGIIVALDKTPSKIALIKEKIQNNNYQSIYPFAFDSTKSLSTLNLKNYNVSLGPPFPPESFDRILLDAPCSALGNRPSLSHIITEKTLKSYPNIQKKLFTNAVGLLKSGGFLVYSTCTVTEAENEGIVTWAIQKFKNLKLISADPIFGGPALEESTLNDKEKKMVQRFGDQNLRTEIDSVGFFIAKFIKM